MHFIVQDLDFIRDALHQRHAHHQQWNDDRRRENPQLDGESDFDAAFDFAHVLRNSHIFVYEHADQNLWPQIDQWMETHKNEICVREVDEIVLVEKQNDGKIDVSIPCFLENGSQYKFEIVGIEVQNRNNEFYVKSWEAIVEQ